MQPLVSICIPTYNRINTLRQSINSALNQTYNNIEIVVSDNNSCDGTEQMVSEIKDNRIKYQKHLVNIGSALNFRSAIEVSKGKYFLMLSSDDWIEPELITNAVSILESTPRIGIYHAAFWGIDVNGRKRLVESAFKPLVESSDVRLILGVDGIGLLTAVVRRDAYNQVGPLVAHPACDWLLWMRIMLNGWTTWYDPRPFGYYSFDPKNGMENLIQSDNLIQFEQYIMDEIIPRCSSNELKYTARKGLGANYYRAARILRKRKEISEAWKLYTKAASFHASIRWKAIYQSIYPRLILSYLMRIIRRDL